MPVLPGAEPYRPQTGQHGVLLCHGFTGSPRPARLGEGASRQRAGLSVSLPRLPGHGTTWQEMARTRWEDWYAEVNRAYNELRGRADQFVMGLSMGGCLALRLAEAQGAAISGLVLVNPSVTADARLFALAPVLKLFVPSLKGIAGDIKKEGVTELGYGRIPVPAARDAARPVAQRRRTAQ